MPAELAPCTSGKAPAKLKGIYRFQSNIWSFRQCLFHGRPCTFRKTVLNCKRYLLPGFIVEESRCWTGLPFVQTFHQFKAFGAPWSDEYNKEEPGMLSMYNSISGMNGTTFLTQMSSSGSPRCLWPVVKRRGRLHSCKRCPIPIFFLDLLLPSKKKRRKKTLHFLSLNVRHIFYNLLWKKYEFRRCTPWSCTSSCS